MITWPDGKRKYFPTVCFFFLSFFHLFFRSTLARFAERFSVEIIRFFCVAFHAIIYDFCDADVSLPALAAKNYLIVPDGTYTTRKIRPLIESYLYPLWRIKTFLESIFSCIASGNDLLYIQHTHTITSLFRLYFPLCADLYETVIDFFFLFQPTSERGSWKFFSPERNTSLNLRTLRVFKCSTDDECSHSEKCVTSLRLVISDNTSPLHSVTHVHTQWLIVSRNIPGISSHKLKSRQVIYAISDFTPFSPHIKIESIPPVFNL